MATIEKGMMVTDASQNRRHYLAVYTVRAVEGDRALVDFAGEVVNGRLSNFPRTRNETYRDLANLREWR